MFPEAEYIVLGISKVFIKDIYNVIAKIYGFCAFVMIYGAEIFLYRFFSVQ